MSRLVWAPPVSLVEAGRGRRWTGHPGLSVVAWVAARGGRRLMGVATMLRLMWRRAT